VFRQGRDDGSLITELSHSNQGENVGMIAFKPDINLAGGMLETDSGLPFASEISIHLDMLFFAAIRVQLKPKTLCPNSSTVLYNAEKTSPTPPLYNACSLHLDGSTFDVMSSQPW
jgi:hypothetical protein